MAQPGYVMVQGGGVVGEGFQVGKSGQGGFVLFDKKLAKEMTSTTFTVSAFFRLPGSVSSETLTVLISEFFDFSYSGDTRNLDGICFRGGTGDGSEGSSTDRDFSFILRESGGLLEHKVRMQMGSSSIANDVWHHIVMSGNGSTAKCYFNDSEITDITVTSNQSGFTPDASHEFVVGTTFSGLNAARAPVGNVSGFQYQNIFLDNQYVDLDTESNRRIFLNADGTPTTGTPQISSTDPVLFISGTRKTVDNFENPGGAGSTHTVTRTNLFNTGINKIDVI